MKERQPHFLFYCVKEMIGWVVKENSNDGVKTEKILATLIKEKVLDLLLANCEQQGCYAAN